MTRRHGVSERMDHVGWPRRPASADMDATSDDRPGPGQSTGCNPTSQLCAARLGGIEAAIGGLLAMGRRFVCRRLRFRECKVRFVRRL